MHFLAANFLMSIWHWITSFDALAFVQTWMSTDWGYAVLFGLLLSCGVGMPLPEDIPLMIAGYFVADGRMNVVIACFCAWCGIMGGDCILYSLGMKFGMGVTKLPVLGHHIDKERVGKVHDLFEKYGAWVVAIGRLFAGIRGVMVLTAGTIRFTFWKFIIADGLAAVVSGGCFIGLGYWARTHFGNLYQVKSEIEKYMHAILVVLVAGVLVFAGWQWWKNRQKETRKRLIQQQAKLREAASRQV